MYGCTRGRKVFRKYRIIGTINFVRPLKTMPGILVGEDEANENVKKVSSSFTIFLVVVIIVLFFVMTVFVTNTVFFSEVRKQGCGLGMSQTEANIMFWLNLTCAVIVGILILVAIFYIFFAKSAPIWTQKITGVVGYQPGTKVQPYYQCL